MGNLFKVIFDFIRNIKKAFIETYINCVTNFDSNQKTLICFLIAAYKLFFSTTLYVVSYETSEMLWARNENKDGCRAIPRGRMQGLQGCCLRQEVGDSKATDD